MIEKEEKMTLEEQRINELLTEGFDRSKYPKLTPNYIPPEMIKNCISIEQFEKEGINYLTERLKECYGISN